MKLAECPNNWPDGTCPECGQSHYVLMRRERVANLVDLDEIKAKIQGFYPDFIDGAESGGKDKYDAFARGVVELTKKEIVKALERAKDDAEYQAQA